MAVITVVRTRKGRVGKAMNRLDRKLGTFEVFDDGEPVAEANVGELSSGKVTTMIWYNRNVAVRANVSRNDGDWAFSKFQSNSVKEALRKIKRTVLRDLLGKTNSQARASRRERHRLN